MYYDESIYEELPTENGRHRVVIRYQDDIWAPDGDCFGAVIMFDGGSASTVSQSNSATQRREDYSEIVEALWRDLRDMAEMEAVLRGTMNICEECGLVMQGFDEGTECEGAMDQYHVKMHDFSDNPIVGFDYYDHRDGRTLINIVTLRDLKEWGWESLEAFQERRPGLDPSVYNLEEFKSWLNGEVFYVDVEEKCIERTEVRTVASGIKGEPIRVLTKETWEQTGDYFDYSCGGFYGHEAAAEYAKGILDTLNEEAA